jgi:hypothetical protein
MNKMLALGFVACLLVPSFSLAQTKSPFVGTWKLDVAQSDLGGEPPMFPIVLP